MDIPDVSLPVSLSRRLNWKRAALAAASVTAVLVAAWIFALLRTPGWYDPLTVPVDRRQEVRDNLVRAEQAFTESLRADAGRFVYHVYQDDFNRWIAMRREIYPLIDELAPPMLADPFALFEEGRITIAGRFVSRGPDVVLSVDISPSMEGSGIVLRVTAVRCGSVEVPLSFVSGLGLNETIEREPDETWPGSPRMYGDFAGGLRIDSQAWWKNGGTAYRVVGVSVQPGRLDIEIEPLGHQSGKDRRRQASPASRSR